MATYIFDNTVKPCLKRPLKMYKTKVLMERCSLMKVESTAECSPWSILQYFWPALSDNWYCKPIICVPFEWPLKTGFTVNEYVIICFQTGRLAQWSWGAQWLRCRVLDFRLLFMSKTFSPHCQYLFNQGNVPTWLKYYWMGHKLHVSTQANTGFWLLKFENW